MKAIFCYNYNKKINIFLSNSEQIEVSFNAFKCNIKAFDDMKHEMHFQLIIVKQVNIELFNNERRSESKWIGSIKLYPDIEEKIVGSIAFQS